MPTQPLINIRIRGLDEVQAFLKTVPRGTIRPAMEAITEYIRGPLPGATHGLVHYPPYKYSGFKKPPKKRYVRTFRLRYGWAIVGSDYKRRLINNVPYARYVQGDPQSRYFKRSNWRPFTKVITDNMKGALRAGDSAVAKWIKEHNR